MFMMIYIFIQIEVFEMRYFSEIGCLPGFHFKMIFIASYSSLHSGLLPQVIITYYHI